MKIIKNLILMFTLLCTALSSMPMMANATVSTNLNKVTYNGNDVTTTWGYSFPIILSSDLKIYLTDSLGTITLLLTNYSIDTVNSQVTYPTVASGLSPLPSGWTITLYRNTPLTQITSLATQGAFVAKTVERSLDKLTMITQQHDEALNRAVLLPITATNAFSFPSSSPGFLIGWKGDGNLGNLTNPSLVAQWTISNADISYSSGNVGIGTFNPQVSLENNGDFITKGSIADVRSGAFGGKADNSTDNLAAINACFASSAQTCRLTDGGWKVSGTIVVPAATGYGTIGKKLLLDQGAIIRPTGNFNVVQLKSKARMYGGEIDTTGVGGFSSAMIYVKGSDNIGNGTGADHVFLYGKASGIGTADGIFLDANQASGNIVFSTFSDIYMIGVNHVLLLQAGSAYGSNYVNGNLFSNIIATNFAHGIYVDGDASNSNQVSENMFQNIQLEANGLAASELIYCNSTNNHFNFRPWDLSGTTHIWNFTSTSAYNVIDTEWNQVIANGTYSPVDSGVKNSFYGNDSPNFTGGVGIGTTSSTQQLQVYNATQSNVSLNLNNGNTGGHNWFISSTAGSSQGGQGNLMFQDNTYSSTPLMTLNANGLGIGTSNPTTLLHLKGSSLSYVGGTLENTNTGGKKWLIAATGGGAAEGQGNLIVKDNTDSTVPLTITSSSIGIGTTVPGQLIDVYSSTQSSVPIQLNNGNTGGRKWMVASTGGASAAGQGRLSFIDNTGGANSNRMVIDPSGNVGIGTTVPPTSLYVVGAVQATSGYNAPDGTAPLTATCGGTSVTSITIKGGMITACSGT